MDITSGYNPQVVEGGKEVDIPIDNIPSGSIQDSLTLDYPISSKGRAGVISNRIDTSENVNEIIRNAEGEWSEITAPNGTPINQEDVDSVIRNSVEKAVNKFNKIKPK
jgi:hypothetical protein